MGNYTKPHENSKIPFPESECLRRKNAKGWIKGKILPILNFRDGIGKQKSSPNPLNPMENDDFLFPRCAFLGSSGGTKGDPLFVLEGYYP